MEQATISETDFKQYGATRATKAGYGPVASAAFDHTPKPPLVDGVAQNVEQIATVSSSAVNERLARRLIGHFGDYETFRQVAESGTDEDGYDELVAIPGVSTRTAAAIRRELAEIERENR